jgi:hypothetical protein
LLILPSPAGREIVLATGAGIRSHEAAEPAGLAVHTTRPCLLLLDGHQFIFGLCRMKTFSFINNIAKTSSSLDQGFHPDEMFMLSK